MHDCWTEEDYTEVFGFVEEHLWLFVQANAAVHRPQQIVSSLTQLNYNDLRFLQRTHFLLSQSVQKSIRESTSRLLRRLVQSTDRVPTELNGAVRGSVDWNLTLKRRLASGFSSPTLFVTRTVAKTYDLPEMQALKYLLIQVNRLCSEVLGSIPEEYEERQYTPDEKWKENLLSLYHLTNAHLKHISLRNISLPAKLTDALLQRVRCARNAHFKDIYESLRLYRKLFVQEKEDALRDCITRGVLKPLNRDTLYEIYVLFLTLASFEQAGWKRESLRLIGYGKGAVAQYRCKAAALRIYYQTLPHTVAQNSLYTNLLRKYSIDVSLRRPDLLLELEAKTSDFLLVEVKRTQDKDYIVDSIYKVLGYLKDFEHSFETARLPHALLIVWDGIRGSADANDALVILNRDTFRPFLESAVIGKSYECN